VDQVVDRFVARERQTIESMRHYHPIVETYYQGVRPDEELGTAPANDRYFIGRLDLTKGLQERFYTTVEKPRFKRLLSVFRVLNLLPPSRTTRPLM
jgi:hypothetical protein